jgi:hypothetical protein
MNEIRISAQISQDLAGGFAAGQWIEVADDERLLKGEPGVFAQLSTVEGQVLTVQSWPGGAAPTLAADAILRRWESGELTIETPATNDGFLALEDGVEIRFEDPDEYHTGDYWVVAGRATAGVLWPVDATGDPVPLEPHGVRHHFAPLATVRLEAGNWQPPPPDMAKRCRKTFRPVTTDPGEPKVKVSGDMMTGKLTIDADLMVLGVATIGDQTSAGVKGKLVMDQTPIEPATGDGAERGIYFPKVTSPAQATDEAFLRRFASGTQRKLVLGVGNSGNEVLSLRQRGQDLVTLTGDGNVGIGTSDPQAGLHVDVSKIILDGPLFIPGNRAPERDQVLTVIDSAGQAEWKDLPERQVGVPAFLSNKVLVAGGSGQTGGWVTFEIDPAKVPPDASAVILEAEGAQAGPDSGDVDTRLLIRRGPDEAELLLLRGRAAGGGDSVAWAGQGIYPVRKGDKASFQFRVTHPGFPGGYTINLVGFYP